MLTSFYDSRFCMLPKPGLFFFFSRVNDLVFVFFAHVDIQISRCSDAHYFSRQFVLPAEKSLLDGSRWMRSACGRVELRCSCYPTFFDQYGLYLSLHQHNNAHVFFCLAALCGRTVDTTLIAAIQPLKFDVVKLWPLTQFDRWYITVDIRPCLSFHRWQQLGRYITVGIRPCPNLHRTFSKPPMSHFFRHSCFLLLRCGPQCDRWRNLIVDIPLQPLAFAPVDFCTATTPGHRQPSGPAARSVHHTKAGSAASPPQRRPHRRRHGHQPKCVPSHPTLTSNIISKPFKPRIYYCRTIFWTVSRLVVERDEISQVRCMPLR